MNDQEKNIATSSDQRLEAWLEKAPMLPASPEFCRNVMRAIEAKPRLWRTRIRELFFARRNFQWNLASAMASIVVMVTAGVLAVQWHRNPAPPAIANNAVPTAMPAAANLVIARFQLSMPTAREVAVVGDFGQWQQRYTLKKLLDGTWTTDIPLPPGTYEYIFVVDQQQWVTDPRAKVYRDDGFGNKNAVLNVLSL